MPASTPRGRAPDASSSSSFLAVAADSGGDALAATPAQRLERRAFARRLHDAAMAEVLGARPVLVVAVLAATLPLALVPWWLSDTVVLPAVANGLAASGVAAVSLVFAAGRSRQAQHAPRSDRCLGGIAVVTLVLLALLAWSTPTATPAAACLASASTVLVAFTAVALLAPLGRLAGAAAALPLSPALANLLRPEPAATALGMLCLCAAGVAGLLAWRQHRRWRRGARTAIEQSDRIRGLEAARDAAIKADQEKSRFLAIASHDLRQPVHAIGLFAATLEKRLEGSAEEPLVRNMSRAIDGLDRSFNVMLDISRLDAGAIEPRIQQFPLRDLFRRLHMHFAGQAEQKSLGLRFSPGGKSVSSDPQLLERIVGNLVQNAIKYTERGGVVVVARSTATHLHLEVWDTGIGIRAGDLRKVFDEFYQVGQRERVRTQGLGMGLAIVKRLVRLLGHELMVASRPGRGTLFRLRIALGGLPGIADITAGADTLPMPPLQPRTVLVLDDEEAIRESLCLLLQEWGYEAIAAASIAEAERAVRQLDAPPDLILSDLHLGDGPDGIEGIEAIRRQCGCDVAAMLITGDTSHGEIRRATESGHPLLFKPVQPRKLYDALRGLGT
jgi:signal transduction histidine kinase